MRSAIALVALMLAASTALAQATADEEAKFPVERLRPALDRDGIIDVEAGGVGDHMSYDLGLWLNYAYNPLTLSRRGADGLPERVGVLVGHRASASLVGAISLFEFVELGAELPVVLFQSRGDGIPTTTAVLSDLNAVGVGDIRVAPKLRLLRQHKGNSDRSIPALSAADGFLDLAIIPAFTLPTGFPEGSYMGEGFLTFLPEVAASWSNFGLRLGANAGMRFRPESRIANLTVSHEVTWRAGAAYNLQELLKVPLDLAASLNGATALMTPFASVNQNPIELMGAATYDVYGPVQVFAGAGFGLLAGFGTPDLRLFAGIRLSPRTFDRDGDGIVDDDDQCPDEAEDIDGFDDLDGCPDPDNDNDGIEDNQDRCPETPGVPENSGCPEGDADGDGVPDALDSCPEEPEDMDDFADGDGCPDLDNDEDGVPDTEDKCPLVAEDADGFQDEDGCPDPDNDEDGMSDAEDKCPDEAEDFDGFRDDDGCPEPDNDEDGIEDANDKCPDEPEDFDGDEDDDGCPDDTKIVITKSKVEILETVYFDTGRATIKAVSFQLLRDVAQVIRDNPEIGRIQVQGHTDNVGSDGLNLILSQRRAESVRRFLIQQGVDRKRLTAKGFGESDPIATNDTPEGRQKNRRVIFQMLAAE
jgi:outer membrane protein OmpA-like peptidoglycan-associated protein